MVCILKRSGTCPEASLRNVEPVPATLALVIEAAVRTEIQARSTYRAPILDLFVPRRCKSQGAQSESSNQQRCALPLKEGVRDEFKRTSVRVPLVLMYSAIS